MSNFCPFFANIGIFDKKHIAKINIIWYYKCIFIVREMNMDKIDGVYLKELRLAHGYTLRSLAEKIYVSKSTIENWEKKSSLNDESIVNSLAKLYGIDRDEILLHKVALASYAEKDLSPSESIDDYAAIAESTPKRHPLIKTAVITLLIDILVLAVIIFCIYLYVIFNLDLSFGGTTVLSIDWKHIIAIILAILFIPVAMAVLVKFIIRRNKK